MKKKGYTKKTLSFNRKAVIASASVTKKKNTIHSFTEVDVSLPRKLMNEHVEKLGEKLSFTAYIVACLANTLKDYPEYNSFHTKRNMIILEDLTISVLIEREIKGEKVPEPIGLKNLQEKSVYQIHHEIREAQKTKEDRLGNLSESGWFRFIPGFLLRMFIQIADGNIKMAKKYGKIGVTAVGMFGKETMWFIPHGSATVLLTIGGINEKVIQVEDKFESREHLCLTASFDHDIVDGAPAARFMKQLMETIKSGELLKEI